MSDEGMATSKVTKMWRHHKVTCLRSLVLISGCWLEFCAGGSWVVYVYIAALKDLFQLTQTQVEIANALCLLGTYAGFVPGSLLPKFGTRRTLMCGAVIGGASYFLLYSACLKKEFYVEHPGFICFYLLMIGIGNTFAIYVPMVTCFQSFRAFHRGKLIGLSFASFAVGRTVFATIYTAFFTEGQVSDPGTQDLAGFLLTVAISIISANIFAMAFLNIYPPDYVAGYVEIAPTADVSLQNISQSEVAGENEELDNNSKVSALDMLKSKSFQLLCWQMIFCGAAQLMFLDNLVIYLVSFRLRRYISMISILAVAIQVLAKLILGYMSDCLREYFLLPRILLVLVAHAIQTMAFAFCIFYAQNFSFFVVVLVVVSVAFGCVNILVPTIISERYGFTRLAFDCGCLSFFMCLTTLGVEAAFGAMYTREITEPGEEDCFGLPCFKWSFVIATCLSLLGSVLNAYSFYADLRKLRGTRTP